MSNVAGMPIRLVVTKKIVDPSLIVKSIEPGEIIDLDRVDAETFKRNYPDNVQQIEMTEEDWMNLINTRALACQKRIFELEQLYGNHFSSYCMGIIPKNGAKIDPKLYGGKISDIYNKLNILESEIKTFEKNSINNLNKNEKHIYAK